jgi:paraquat-inducible protein B
MSNKASTTLIGAFIVGATGIVIISLLFFTGGDFFRNKTLFVIHFDRSIQGLELGAALKLRGVKIGEVTKIESHFDDQTMTVINSVYVQVLDGKTRYAGKEAPHEMLRKLVTEHGLRAQLKQQSYLTGLLYIEVDFTGKPGDIKLWNLDPDTFELPTTPTEIEKLTDVANQIDFQKIADAVDSIVTSIDQFLSDPQFHAISGNINNTLARVETLALHTDQIISNEVAATLTEMQRLITGINRDYPDLSAGLQQSLASLERSFVSLEGAIRSTSHIVSDDSPLLFEFKQTLGKISRAADNVSILAESLERQPEALLRGKSSR